MARALLTPAIRVKFVLTLQLCVYVYLAAASTTL